MPNRTRSKVLDRIGEYRAVYCGGKATDAAEIQGICSNGLSVISVVGDCQEINPETDGISIENLFGYRPDYDEFSWDNLPQEPTETLVGFLNEKTSDSPIIIIPFSASWLFCNVSLTLENCLYAGNFVSIEQAFNHKPWAEQEMRRIDVPVLPWKH